MAPSLPGPRCAPVVALTLAGLLLAVVPGAHAQQVGSVVGQVVAEGSGRPLSGALVTLVELARTESTDQNGRFSFAGVAPGSYTVDVVLIGREAATSTAGVSAGETAALTIPMAVDALRLPGITVTSEKFVRDLQETRASVGVVRERAIRSLPVRDWEDATLLVGNVSVSGAGAFSIRGIPNTGVGGGTSPTAVLYVDGVQQGRFTTSRSVTGAWDLEAVEVLRGPQSTLSGRNALAGAVYLRSARPSFDWSAAARVRGGAEDALEGAFMLTGPLIEDQLAFRVSAESGEEDRALTFRNVSSNDAGFERTSTTSQWNVKNRLLFTPTSIPGLSVLANYTRSFNRPIGFQGASRTGDLEFEDRVSVAGNAFFDEADLNNASLEIGYDLSPSLALTASTGYLDADYRIDGLTYQTDDPDVIVPVAQRSSTDESTRTQELRLNYETDRTRAVVGAFYGRFDFDRTRNDGGDIWFLARPQLEANPQVQQILQGQPLPRFGIIFDARSRDGTEDENVAFFGEINRQISEHVTLTAGLRYDRESFDSFTRSDSVDVSFEGAPPQIAAFEPQIVGIILSEVNTDPSEAGTAFDVLLPKVGLTWDFSDDVSLGGTVQRGYRAGGAQALTVGELNVFDPEFTWNYELAFRSRLAGGRLIANANIFHTDWTDQQVSVPLQENPNFSRVENAGESTLYGAEVELRAAAADGLTLFTSLGVAVSEFDEFERDGVDLAGFEFPGAPGETLSAGAILDRDTGIFGALNVSYVGEHYSRVGSLEQPGGGITNDPALRAGDYTIVDGQIGYSFDLRGVRTRLTGFARNLFDEVALDTVIRDTFGVPTAQLRQPRVVGVSLDLQF